MIFRKILIGFSILLFFLSGDFLFADETSAVSQEVGAAKGVDLLVIAGMPFLEKPQKGLFKPTWTQIENSLTELANIGVNVILLWAPNEHRVSDSLESITVSTKTGEMTLRITRYVHVKDYLKLDPTRGSKEQFLHMIKKAHSLGIKVIGQLQVTVSNPGDFIYDNHPDWILKSIYGKPAIFWPWAINGFGYIVNKAHPGLIEYVAETVIPHWVNEWGLDGVYLDSPIMAYSGAYIMDLCEYIGPPRKGYEFLTPVNGYYTPQALSKAMRVKINQLKRDTGRELVLSCEEVYKTWRDMPDNFIVKFYKGSCEFRDDQKVDRSLGKYFDWTLDYRFRNLLRSLFYGTDDSYSENFTRYFDVENELEALYTKKVKFLNAWVDFAPYINFVGLDNARCYMTLAVTSPGKTIWIGEYQSAPADTVKEIFGYETKSVMEYYKKLIYIKKTYPVFQNDNIEDALIYPKAKGALAYNRWMEENDESATVIVNLTDKPVVFVVKTRFEGRNIHAYDLLTGEKFIIRKPQEFPITLQAFDSKIIALEEIKK